MKIFSNFDTSLKKRVLKEYQDKYGVENVLCFWRSRLYRAYKFFVPFVLLSLSTLFLWIFFYEWLGDPYYWYGFLFLFVIFIVFLIPLMGKYIDYKMDFIIVIPSYIVLYDQWWLFKKNVITINAQSVKSISVKKNGLLYSIFDNGDLVILTEWDIEQNGEIKLRRVPRPEKRRNQMVKVIGIDIEDFRRVGNKNGVNFHFCIANASRLPFSEKSFDCVTAFWTLHHINDPLKILQEIDRILKVGGQLIILEDLIENTQSFKGYLTKIYDKIINLEFSSHPHSNQSLDQWNRMITQKFNYQVIELLEIPWFTRFNLLKFGLLRYIKR